MSKHVSLNCIEDVQCRPAENDAGLEDVALNQCV